MKHFILFFLLVGNTLLFSQNTENFDVRFLEAKKLERNGNRIEAINQTEKLINEFPNHVEVAIFGAQLQAFEKNHSESLKRLEKLNETYPNNYDILSVYIDVLRWDNQNEKSIQVSNALLQLYPDNEEILIKKGKSLEIQTKNEEALKIFEQVLAKNPTQEDALAAKKRLSQKQYKNHLGVFYYNSSFVEKLAPWHMGGFELMRKTKVFPLRAQLTTATRYDEFATQLEMEAYPKLSAKMSAHVGLGFANNLKIFPDWRSTLDIYRTLPKKFEVSLGFRTLKYNNGINMIYAGYLGKYYKNFWFVYRGYVFSPPDENNLYLSHTAMIRRYGKDIDNFTSISFFTGNTPFSVGWLNQIYGVTTQGINVEQQVKIKMDRILKLGFMYENEEYAPEKTRNRLTFMFTLINRF